MAPASAPSQSGQPLPPSVSPNPVLGRMTWTGRGVAASGSAMLTSVGDAVGGTLVADGVAVRRRTGVFDAVGVAVSVGVAVLVGVLVAVSVGVGVWVAVSVGVGV